jgi:hypothetical protein
MYVTLKQDHDIHDLKWHLWQEIQNYSRFTASFEIVSDKRIRIRDVRLKDKKRYCGNHPNACDIEGGRMGKFLEGLDWVEFNDRLNDVLDRLNLSARIFSDVCEVRDGRERRINYGSIYRHNFFEWEKKGSPSDYEDWCGKKGAPASDYPFGTPGLYERKVDEHA